jgi:hypothetical protein
MTRTVWYSLSLILILVLPARAAVIVNEVLANEPHDSTTLEWIELYNDSPDTVSLDFYSITVVSSSGGSTGFAVGDSIAGESYVVYCRSEPVYDVRWGDGSGLWGDGLGESEYEVKQLSFSLTNNSGAVILSRAGLELSRLEWTGAGLDGHSWERVHPGSDRIEQCVDPAGSTPGRQNSVAALPYDLALEDVAVSSTDGFTTLSYTIVNRGLNPVNDDTLHLYYFDSTAADSLGQLIASEAVGPVDTGFTIILIGQYSLPGVYVDLVAQLNDDDRPVNNRQIFTAGGQNYPPVILSEFLANPDQSPDQEWVELRNRSRQPVDLIGWQLGDSTGLQAITEESLIVDPGHYLVLVMNTIDFLTRYPDFSGVLHEPSSWRQLNNGSDVVRLVDAFGIEADRFDYSEVFDSNHTWARAESGPGAGEWGRSQDAGGTPGEANRVQFEAGDDNRLAIDIQPRIISPDGDGIDDEAVLSLSRPEATAYTLKIYDKAGRLVRTFEDELSGTHFNDEYVWDGTNNSHERLPIGIYVVFFEASGVESVKTTVVIAR